jgi:hypothetical protein
MESYVREVECDPQTVLRSRKLQTQHADGSKQKVTAFGRRRARHAHVVKSSKNIIL